MPCRRRIALCLVVASVALGTSACGGGDHSILDPHSPTADRIALLGWLMIAIAGAVFLLVLVLIARAVVGHREETHDPSGPPERRFLLSSKGWIAAGGIALPAVVVLMLSGFTVNTLASDSGPSDLEIHVTGRQYFWQVQYPGFETANIIHLPVGRTTKLRLDAADVIHSLWVPELGAKRDMIPGHTSTLVWKPDTTGTFRGQCAEYCGLQHANMALLVVVETPEQFAAWEAHEAQDAAAPTGAAETRGEQVFLNLPCSSCHQIRGLNSIPEGVKLRDGGLVIGPDLTHVGSRPLLGAGTIANQPDAMAQWISDSQLAKPGNRMPPIPISNDDLSALVAYLESLK